MGNSKGIVKRLKIETIDAAKLSDKIIFKILKESGEIVPKKRKTLNHFMKKYYDLIELHEDSEEWKDIILGDYILYQISNHGRVRRKDTGYIINPFHSYRKDSDGNFIKSRPTYLRVQLYYYENGIRKKKHCEISRLVAKYFIPIPRKYIEQGYTEDTLEVNHIHGGYEIYNNFSSNLEWCTQQENIDKAFETRLRHPPYGENHHSTYVIETDVINICECIEKGYNCKDTYDLIKMDNNISYKKFKPLYYNIKYKKSWTYISQNFDI